MGLLVEVRKGGGEEEKVGWSVEKGHWVHLLAVFVLSLNIKSVVCVCVFFLFKCKSSICWDHCARSLLVWRKATRTISQHSKYTDSSRWSSSLDLALWFESQTAGYCLLHGADVDVKADVGDAPKKKQQQQQFSSSTIGGTGTVNKSCSLVLTSTVPTCVLLFLGFSLTITSLHSVVHLS